ncbi:hypothetical protein JCM3765_006441 [Sporobolomyces pararoseus]
MIQQGIALPPPILPAQQSRVGYNNRGESNSTSPQSFQSTNGGMRGRDVDLGAAGSRGWDRNSVREEETSQERSDLRDGRNGSSVPLFQGQHGRRISEKDVEKAGGKDWEEAEKEKMGRRSKSSGPSFLKNLGRHFIGVRDKQSIKSPLIRPLQYLSQPHENYLLAFLGAFVAILGAGGISYAFKNVKGFEGDTPLAIGSLGATAVLLYVVPESPLSQPRNVIGGHMVSALSGVIISQLFALNSRFTDPLSEDNTVVQQNSWYHLTPVAYALAVAIAIFGMQVTKTVHPPGGATALIASAHRTVDGRYTYLLDIFLAVTWMTLWSFFINNLGRRKYPMFWWTPKQPPKSPASKIEEKEINILPTTNPLTNSSNPSLPSRISIEKTGSAPQQFDGSPTGPRRKLGNLNEEEHSNASTRNARGEEENGRRQKEA